MRAKLREAREQLKLRQVDVASVLGMKERNYRNIESGKRGTGEDNWLKLYRLFNCKVPLHELMETTSLDSLPGEKSVAKN